MAGNSRNGFFGKGLLTEAVITSNSFETTVLSPVRELCSKVGNMASIRPTPDNNKGAVVLSECLTQLRNAMKLETSREKNDEQEEQNITPSL